MNNELKFGLYSGLAFSIWCMAEFLTGIHNAYMNVAQYTEMIGGIIPWIFIFIGIRYRKTVLQNGQLTFGQGVRSGMIISLISSLIISIFFYVYVNVINSGYNKSKLAFLQLLMVEKKIPAEILKHQMEGYMNMYNGTIGAHLTLMVFFASIGIVVSAFISLLLRSKMPPPSAN